MSSSGVTDLFEGAFESAVVVSSWRWGINLGALNGACDERSQSYSCHFHVLLRARVKWNDRVVCMIVFLSANCFLVHIFHSNNTGLRGLQKSFCAGSCFEVDSQKSNSQAKASVSEVINIWYLKRSNLIEISNHTSDTFAALSEKSDIKNSHVLFKK